MKRLILLVLLPVLFCGCKKKEPPEPPNPPEPPPIEVEDVVLVPDFDAQVTVTFLEVLAGTVKFKTAGTYNLFVTSEQSRNRQLNESYFVRLMKGETAVMPVNPNAGPDYVVEDSGGDFGLDDAAGMFVIPEAGPYDVLGYHYKGIAETYPQFMNGDVFGKRESVHFLRFVFKYVRDN